MKRVVVESPLAGNFRRNVRYAQLCVLDCLQRGEAPFASDERELGIRAGLCWGEVADLSAFYVDFGWSKGMERAWQQAEREQREREQRRLPVKTLLKMREPPDRWCTSLVKD